MEGHIVDHGHAHFGIDSSRHSIMLSGRVSQKRFHCHVRASCAPHTAAATERHVFPPPPAVSALSQILMILHCSVWPAGM